MRNPAKKNSNKCVFYISAYGDVVATLERLQIQLRDISGALGISDSGIAAELEAVRTLLVQHRFASALSMRHALKNRLRVSKILKHHTDDATSLVRDVRKKFASFVIQLRVFMRKSLAKKN